MGFILSNLATIIIGAVLLLVIIFAVISIIKDKKNGKCLGGCSGCDSKCHKCNK